MSIRHVLCELSQGGAGFGFPAEFSGCLGSRAFLSLLSFQVSLRVLGLPSGLPVVRLVSTLGEGVILCQPHSPICFDPKAKVG